MRMSENVAEMLDRKRAATIALLQNWAGRMEGQAKQNAPWTDRTGNARIGIQGGVEVGDNRFTLFLSHGVDYGIYLEKANAGRYAIVDPTIDSRETRVKKDVRDLWGAS